MKNTVEILLNGCTIYSIRCNQTGVVIDEFSSFQSAKNALIQYEQEDIKDGIYEPNFYEIHKNF